MIVVLDTNVLVSALWTPNGKAAYIVNQVIVGNLKLCHDYRILTEYRDVLTRPKFKFSSWQVNFLMETIDRDGISVSPPLLLNVSFSDESDRMFYEVAKFCGAPLVTGNLKHFPPEDFVMTVTDYYGYLLTLGSSSR